MTSGPTPQEANHSVPSDKTTVKFAPIVQTDNGAVRGMIEANGIFGYKGIPYAADSGGNNRFLPPKPRSAWSDIFDATERGPACPQISPLVEGRQQSEDCLCLSVWTKSTDGRKPVLVWLHGGAYKQGSDDYGAEGADGSAASEMGDFVFVSPTHRLHALGFLQLDASFGPEYSESGNVGMLDLVAALAWVNANIAQFGGDPDNVTIAGPSGGGSKTMHLLAMPAARGLFQRAIVLVGHDLWKRNSQASALASGQAYLDHLGITPGDIGALQSLPAEVLAQAAADVYNEYVPDPRWGAEGWIKYDVFSPTIDGKVLPEYPVDAITKGASHDVELIVSVDKWTHLIIPRSPPASFDVSLYGRMTFAQLVEVLHPLLDADTDKIIAGYRGALPGASPSSLFAAILTDRDWWIPALRLAEAKAEGGKPARLMFNSSGAGAHSYFFGTNLQVSFVQALLGQVSAAFAAFVATGDPNGADLPNWPCYTPATRDVLMLDYDTHVAQDPFAAERLIWMGIR